ncbi:hypothetical protein BGX29_011067 [Mortierella sp. GBA35]|nr:hypothetical protein BGX29_011067 [Mortierella sp. GBA35]
MAGQATVVSDAASPLRPHKVSSPFVARTSLLFEKPALSSQDSDMLSHGNSPILSNCRTAPSSRRDSFAISNIALNYNNNNATTTNATINNSVRNSFSMADLTKPANRGNRAFEEGKVRKLVTSFSNPPFHPNNSVQQQTGHKLVRSQSAIIESPSTESTDSHQLLNGDNPTKIIVEPPPPPQEEEKEEKEEKKQKDEEDNKEDDKDKVPRITLGSITTLSHLPIGPIARMNCREQIIKDKGGGGDGGFIIHSNQLLGVPFKERVRSHINDSGDGAPCLELNPFSPYSPGILSLESTVAFNHQTENHKSVDLNDFIETVLESLRAIGETLDVEQAPFDAVEEAKEDEVVVRGRQQDQVDTHEEHILVVHLEESLSTAGPTVSVDEGNADVDSVSHDKQEDQVYDAVEIVEGPTHEEQGNLVVIETTVEPSKTVFEAPSVSTAIIEKPVESKEEIAESKEEAVELEEEAVEPNETYPVVQSQSTSQLIQRQDGSTMTNLPHEPLPGSQLLDRQQQQRQTSNSRLNGASLLHLTTSRHSNHSGPSSMLASSSTSGSTASSSTRLHTPQTSNGSTFERQTTMPEDDISMPSASGQSTDQDRSSFQSSDDTDASAAAAPANVATSNSSSNSSRKPAKIVTTRPKGLSMALGRTFSMMLDITTAATTVGFEDGNHEQVISSKVSRTGKLFAQKIKTIANFEYNTSKKLGKGNFGVVYQGNSIQGDDEVAIKKITRKLPGEIEKLGLVQREMKVCRLFRNKRGIVPLRDIITTNKHHYLVFEKAEGDLAEMIKARCKDATGFERINRDPYQQPMSPSCTLGAIFNIHEIRSIMRTVVLGAQSLHHEGFSHKDIKPTNILFREGQGLLCDFGLCSQREELPDNQFFGTQDYTSPEARRVGGSKRCDYIQGDVYSLGAVLYELATGSVLSKVINQGINWQKLALFGGRSFSELIQGMVDDLEKRWTIDRVVNSRFWDEPHPDSASALTAVSDSPFSPLSATASKVVKQGNGGGGDGGGAGGGGGDTNQATTGLPAADVNLPTAGAGIR